MATNVELTPFILQMTVLGLCIWLESVLPFFMDRTRRVRHTRRNLAIGLVNGVVLTLWFVCLTHAAAHWAHLHP